MEKKHTSQIGDPVLRSITYMNAHMDRVMTLEEISDAAGYSKYYFSRLFKRAMGVPVMEYVKRRRLIWASEALLAGRRILETALDCGYDSHSGFTKAFKKEFGFSPVLLKALQWQVDELKGGSSMNHVFMEKMDVHESKEQLLERLLEINQLNGTGYEEEALLDAYSYACQAYGGLKRYSGDEYVTHTLQVAVILASMEASQDQVIAGMLCDLFEKTQESPEQVERKFTAIIKNLLLDSWEFSANEADPDRGGDVLVIKLAERLHNMRTVEFMEEGLREIKARETIRLFIPLAARLGNQKLTDELNDLSLMYIS